MDIKFKEISFLTFISIHEVHLPQAFLNHRTLLNWSLLVLTKLLQNLGKTSKHNYKARNILVTRCHRSFHNELVMMYKVLKNCWKPGNAFMYTYTLLLILLQSSGSKYSMTIQSFTEWNRCFYSYHIYSSRGYKQRVTPSGSKFFDCLSLKRQGLLH